MPFGDRVFLKKKLDFMYHFFWDTRYGSGPTVPDHLARGIGPIKCPYYNWRLKSGWDFIFCSLQRLFSWKVSVEIAWFTTCSVDKRWNSVIYNIYINVIGLNVDQYQPSHSNFSVDFCWKKNILLNWGESKTKKSQKFFENNPKGGGRVKEE